MTLYGYMRDMLEWPAMPHASGRQQPDRKMTERAIREQGMSWLVDEDDWFPVDVVAAPNVRLDSHNRNYGR